MGITNLIFFINIYILIKNFKKNNKKIKEELGIGDWGLGIGDWGLGPIPNPLIPTP